MVICLRNSPYFAVGYASHAKMSDEKIADIRAKVRAKHEPLVDHWHQAH